MICPFCHENELTELMQNEHGNIAYDCPLCGVVHKSEFPQPEHNHTGFYIETEHGPAHVLGDPNMSDETMDALKAMIKAAQDMIANSDAILCDFCDGTGLVVTGWDPDAYENIESNCQYCNGTGREYGELPIADWL